METLGARLRRCRLEHGWSKRAVADELGVSIPSIMRWEDDRADPNDYNRHKIERFLHEWSPPSPNESSADRLELSLFPSRTKGPSRTH